MPLENPPIDGPLVDAESGYGSERFKSWLIRLFDRVGSVTGSIAPSDAPYIIRTPTADLANAQSLSSLDSGFVKVATGTGILSSTATIPSVDLSDTGVSPGTYGSSGSVPVLVINSKGQITDITVSGVSGVSPSGPATGDLSGSYPDPTVSKINGNTLGTTTQLNGAVLYSNGTSWATKIPVSFIEVQLSGGV